ncbi:unnamed protein product, partial [Thlaspi arvense]
SLSPGESGNELRRGQRRRNVRYNFNFDDYFDEEEEEEEEEADDDSEEERKRQKKLKQVLNLNQSRARADPPTISRGRAAARVRHESDYEEEEEYEAEVKEEDDYEEDTSEKRQVKKRKISRRVKEGEKDYDEEVHADSDEDSNVKEKKRSASASGTHCDGSSEPTPILDKKALELILDKLQKKDIYGVYAEPVDPEELPDYHNIVEHPMDFSTVRKKLANGSYLTLEELENDVLLICSNAMQYNSSDTVYYKHARTIQEMGKRKFEKARIKIKRVEKEFKTDEKAKPASSGKKQVSSYFSSGGNLAGGGASQNKPFSTQTSRHVDVLLEGDTSLLDNLEKAEDLSSGLLGKCGRKLTVVEADSRAAYGNSDQQVDRSESIFTTFESEIKQFVAVGLDAENAYGRSLARFAATLGPVAWKIASQRIEQALPEEIKFGRGWVGEYEPLPTPVQTCTPKEAFVFSKPLSNAAAEKNETLFKTLVPAKEQQGNRPVPDGNCPFPFSASFEAVSEGSSSFVATQVGNLKSMSHHGYGNSSPQEFIKPENRISQQVELNLPPPAEQTSSGSACASENHSFGKSDTVASYMSSSDMTRKMTDSEHYKHQMTTNGIFRGGLSNGRVSAGVNNTMFEISSETANEMKRALAKGTQQSMRQQSQSHGEQAPDSERFKHHMTINRMFPGGLSNGRISTGVDNRMFEISSDTANEMKGALAKGTQQSMRQQSQSHDEQAPDSERFKHHMTINRIFPGGLSNGRISTGVDNRMFEISSDTANEMKRALAKGTQQPMRQQSQSHGEQPQSMRNVNEKARTQHHTTSVPPDVSSPQSARSEDSSNASVAAARAWMSIGARGNNNNQTFEISKSSQISAESLYNPSREQQFHQQACKPRSSEGTQFLPQRNGLPFQTFVNQPVHGMMNGGSQPFQNNRPTVFSHMAAPTSDVTRFHVQSPRRGGITPHGQLNQRREKLIFPPDLNIGVHSFDSPAKQSSGLRVDSQQPDLALQL